MNYDHEDPYSIPYEVEEPSVWPLAIPLVLCIVLAVAYWEFREDAQAYHERAKAEYQAAVERYGDALHPDDIGQLTYQRLSAWEVDGDIALAFKGDCFLRLKWGSTKHLLTCAGEPLEVVKLAATEEEPPPVETPE